MRSDVVTAGIVWGSLAVALVASALFGLATTYVLAGFALLALGVLIAQRRRPWPAGPDAAIFALGFLVLLAAFTITARAPADVALAINFVAFLAYAPFAAMYSRLQAPGNALLIAWLALAGVVLTFLICVIQIYGLGMKRAEGINSDTIRFAMTAVIGSFIALIGFISTRSPWRYIFLLAPVLALAVVLLTGTRIAMVTYPVVALVALLLIVPSRWRLLMILGLVALLGVVGLIVAQEGHARFLSIFDSVRQMLSGERVADRATRIRLLLYEGAWDAFLASPLFGHGWAHMMSSVAEFMAPGTRRHANDLVHLHNDMLTMGVSAGLAGIAVWLAVLIAPLVLVLRSPRDSQKPQRVLAISVIFTCYVMMGLTDTMISFEMSTMYYVVLVGAVLHLCRDGTGARQ